MALNLGTGSEDEPEVMVDINTTPLVDVLLVLLVMLIITIPVQLHSVTLEMPRGHAATANSAAGGRQAGRVALWPSAVGR
jgi:biopolymer transport protein ExbD